MMKNKPGPDEQRIIVMSGIAQVTLSALAQVASDQKEFFARFEQMIEKLVTEKIDKEMQATCMADYKAIIHQVKYDLCKQPHERSIHLIKEEKDNVTSVDFGKKN